MAEPEKRRVKLFRNGCNQAVRIPREFELPGHDALLYKQGDRLVIEPLRPKSLFALLDTLPDIKEDPLPIEEVKDKENPD